MSLNGKEIKERRLLHWSRRAVQWWFLLVTAWIGWRFTAFAAQFAEAGGQLIERPASVDAFLPISGLMAVKYFIFTGIVEPFHPAGMFIFLAVITVSFFLSKGFCGWICPIGTISEYVGKAGKKLLKLKTTMPRVPDFLLRFPKYILMAMFLLLIGVAMTPPMMALFFINDYYKTIDVETMQFFTQMSPVAFWVLTALVVLTLIYRNFWCRYLCPYGALLGLLGAFGPTRIKRSAENCTGCQACSRDCPGLLKVHEEEEVDSPECVGCLGCLSRCPTKDALNLTWRGRKPIRPLLYPLLLLVIFYGIIALGPLTGNWQTKVPYEEYQRLLGPPQAEASAPAAAGEKSAEN